MNIPTLQNQKKQRKIKILILMQDREFIKENKIIKRFIAESNKSLEDIIEEI